MAEMVIQPTYARCCVVGPVGTPGGLRETVRLQNADDSMRQVRDVLRDVNEAICNALETEWLEEWNGHIKRRDKTDEEIVRMKQRSLPWCDGGFHKWEWENQEELWPADGYRWIAVYPVTGGSEGHYIHIDLVGETLKHIAMVKTFSGWDKACVIANFAGKLLGA